MTEINLSASVTKMETIVISGNALWLNTSLVGDLVPLVGTTPQRSFA